MRIDNGVSFASTPASAVPYSEAVARAGSGTPRRAHIPSRHSSLKTSPAMTRRVGLSDQSKPSSAARFTTSFRNGG